MDELTAAELAVRSGAPEAEIERFAALGILSSRDGSFRIGDVNRVQLLQALDQSGISPEDVGRAIASGRFSFAFVDALFPADDSSGLTGIDHREMCARFGIDLGFLLTIYAGLGLPQPRPEDPVRADDLEMAPVLLALMAMPLPPGALEHATRFWGENLHRLTQAETRFFEAYVISPLLRSGLSEQQVLDIALPQGAMAQQLDERVLLWLHRRHLQQNLVEQVMEHVESAIERTGAIRRKPREVPAIAFLDLSGFTALTEERGDEAAVELTVALSELVRDTTREHGGRAVKFLGDGVMCHFPHPAEAVTAALEMIEGAPGVGLPPARVGLNAGPLIARDSDYFGRTVNVASRLAAHAGPEQVVVTDDVVAVARVDGVRFEALGPTSLKGIAHPVNLHLAIRS